MAKKFLLLFALLCVSVATAAAQNSFRVEAPRVVSTDETFRVVFTADGKMGDFSWSVPEGFILVWGPQQGQMSNTSIVNGKKTSTYQMTQSYILQAEAEGVHTLPAATCTIDKKEYSSGEFKIEVVKGEGGAASQPRNERDSGEPSREAGSSRTESGTDASRDVFLRLSLSKTDVVKGEPITATLKLYTRADISGFENLNFPSFNGFWSKETFTPQNIEFDRENVGGKIYHSALLRRYMLIPQQTGTVTIDPAEMVCLLRIVSNSGPRSLFDGFFDSYETIRKRISTPAIKVNVRPLPAGAPASFTNAVGDYKISSSISSGELKSHEAATLSVTVSGKGNISMVEAPKIDFPHDFEVYDVKVTDKISPDGISGSRTFEYPFIPRSHGEFTIPQVEFSYYDLAKGSYRTATAEGFTLSVARGEDPSGTGTVMPGVARQGVRDLGQDIRFIHTGDGSLRKAGSFFALSPLYWGLLGLVGALALLASTLLKRHRKMQRDVAATRNRKAVKMARARLSQAADYLKKQLPGAYYEELHKAFSGYLSDKLTLPASSLSKEGIAGALLDGGVSQQSTDEALRILDTCEFARYAPDAQITEMEKLYDDAVTAISDIENQLKPLSKRGIRAMAAPFLLAVALALTASPDAAAALPENLARQWEAAREAYVAADYPAALSLYGEIAEAGYSSADLWYNMGNCHYKIGGVGGAVLSYERALKADPVHADAAFNLEIAKASVLDNIEPLPEFFLVTWWRRIVNGASADTWAVVSLIFAAVMAIMAILFRHLRKMGQRRWCFVLGCIAAALFLLTLMFSASARSVAASSSAAIVMEPSATVMSAPGDGGKAVFVLHEGTRVEILDSLGEWRRVSIADGRQGWLPEGYVEVI